MLACVRACVCACLRVYVCICLCLYVCIFVFFCFLSSRLLNYFHFFIFVYFVILSRLSLCKFYYYNSYKRLYIHNLLYILNTPKTMVVLVCRSQKNRIMCTIKCTDPICCHVFEPRSYICVSGPSSRSQVKCFRSFVKANKPSL